MRDASSETADDEPDEIPVGESLAIHLAHSCLRKLAWDVSYTPQTALWRLLELAPRGFRAKLRAPGLVEFADADGHAILVVEKSCRTQIRVHYLTPVEQRRAVALEIAGRIRAALD